MIIKKNNLKTLGSVSAKLLMALHDHNRPLFNLDDATKILGDRGRASRILFRLTRNGVITRLKSGLFRLVPFELGFEAEYLGNPFVAATALAKGIHQDNKEYYLSHGSAFDLHQMITQPQLIVYLSAPKLIRNRIIQGTEFRFVRCKPKDVFGITALWINKNEKVQVSDLERTLLDGLKEPNYCGGFSEVAKAFSMKASIIDPQKIIDYAIKLNVGALYRRLGFLMELYQIGSRIHWEFLQSKLTSTYVLLDPDLFNEGHFISKWRLRLNIPQEELLAIRGT